LEERDEFWEEKPAPETSYRTLSENLGQCLTEIFSLTFIHGFGHILLTGCPIDPILFCCIRNFEGIIFTLLVGMFITLLQCFGFED
jgi:hypothetical protein